MTDLEAIFRELDSVSAPDLGEDIDRRLKEGPRPDRPIARHAPLRRVLAAVVALTLFAAAAVFTVRAFRSLPRRPAATPSAVSDPLGGIQPGWTRLPEPPEAVQGSAMVWAGSELLSWGGYRSSDHSYLREGFAFDPSTSTWSSIPDAPSPRTGTRPVWTGSEAIFWGGWDGHNTYSDGLAYNPSTRSWRTIPASPVEAAQPSVVAWTGAEMIVWGGGNPGDKSNTAGAAYDPSSDTWRRTADAPIGLNAASGVWTGKELIVFGSLLDNGNRPATRTAVGAAYDPASDRWHEIAQSDLSPQADAAVWLSDRMVAYGYDWKAAEYEPSADRWRPLPELPFHSGECYPDGATIGTEVFAFGCGEAATWSPGENAWRPVREGLTADTIQANGTSYQLWRFATLIPAGDVLFLSAEGLTVNGKGTPCYGCPDSPTSLWAYRPLGR